MGRVQTIGLYRELGKIGLEEYTEIKHIYRNTKPAAVNWFQA